MTLRQRLKYGILAAALAAFAAGYLVPYFQGSRLGGVILGTVVGAAIYIVSWAPLLNLEKLNTTTSPVPKQSRTDKIYYFVLQIVAGLCIGSACALAGVMLWLIVNR
jgi:hypothetical protein